MRGGEAESGASAGGGRLVTSTHSEALRHTLGGTLATSLPHTRRHTLGCTHSEAHWLPVCHHILDALPHTLSTLTHSLYPHTLCHTLSLYTISTITNSATHSLYPHTPATHSLYTLSQLPHTLPHTQPTNSHFTTLCHTLKGTMKTDSTCSTRSVPAAKWRGGATVQPAVRAAVARQARPCRWRQDL